jgi:phosphocarrier protein HPr
MLQQEVIVSNSLGIHARPAALIVQLSSKFTSDIWLEKGGLTANAKSIMSVMMLGAGHKVKDRHSGRGAQEKEAVEALVQLFDSKFNEKVIRRQLQKILKKSGSVRKR